MARWYGFRSDVCRRLTTMDMTSCWHCEPVLLEYALAAALFFFAPVGALVMRRHIQEATGIWRALGIVLQALGLISMPFAVLLIVSVTLQALF